MIDLIVETLIFLAGIWFGFNIAVRGEEADDE
jgi:hypothetical protein